MAELPCSAQKALQKLKEQLTCSICLEHYTDPKLLKCFHVFCEKCVAPLARQTRREGVQTVKCPNCRQRTNLPPNGVAGLRSAFPIHHLFDIHDTLEKVRAPAKVQCSKCKKRKAACYCRTCKFICKRCKDFHSEWDEFSSHEIISLEQVTTDVLNRVSPAKKVLLCPSHPEKPVDLFCETCEEMICRDCIVRVHHDHQYDLVQVAFPKHKEVIVASLQPVKKQLDSVTNALESLDTLCDQITDQRQALKTEVKSNVRQIHQALEVREEKVLTQIDEMADQKLKNTAGQRDQMQLVLKQLTGCCEFVEDSLKTGSQEEILNIKKSVVNQVQDITIEFKLDMLLPKEEVNMQFYHGNREELVQSCHQFGRIASIPLDPSKCLAEGEGLHIAVLGETATARIHLQTIEGKSCTYPVDVQFELVSRDGSSRVRGKAKQTGDRCAISYNPECSGQYRLHICVENVSIARSPFFISAFTTTPTNVITGLNQPWGVAVTDQGQVLVAEHGHRVTIINCDGERRSFGTRGCEQGQTNDHDPVHVAPTKSGGMMVCNTSVGDIQMFSFDGILVNHQAPFSLSHGIAVHPHTNKIYVTNPNANLIQILNTDLTPSGSFGGMGSDNGQLNSPRSIAFDGTGNLFVADHDNNRVQIFTADGEYVCQFGKKGDGEGDLNGPSGVEIDSSGIVYISEMGNNRISVFTRDGKFLRSFGSRGNGPGQFNWPTDVAVGTDGKIYIADYNNGRIQVF